MAHSFTLTVEQDEDDAGLWYVTSSTAVPGARLFIAVQTLEEALAAVPDAMADLQKAMLKQPSASA